MANQDPFAQGKITPKQYADWYRQQHPEYSVYLAGKSDDDIVNAVMRNDPTLAQRLIGGTGPMTGQATVSGPLKSTSVVPFAGVTPAQRRQFGYSAGNIFAESLPGVTSAIGAGIMAPTGPLGMIAGAGAGSVPGSLMETGVKRLIFPPSKGWEPPTAESTAKNVMSNMATNMLFESLGAGLRALPVVPDVFSAARGLGTPESQALQETNREFGLGLTYPQMAPTPENIERFSAFPRAIKTSAIRMKRGDEMVLENIRRATQELPGQAFGRTTGAAQPFTSGEVVENAISNISSPLVKARTRGLVAAWNFTGQNIVADPAAIQSMKADLLQEITDREAAAQSLSDVAGEPNRMMAVSARTQAIYDDILRLPDQGVPVVTLNQFRQRLLQETPIANEPFSQEAPGQAKYFVKKLTGIIEDSVKGTPAESYWKQYRSFYDRSLDVFKSQQIKALLNQDPEKLAQIVGVKDFSAALRVRQAILGYANRLGSPEQRRAALDAWNHFRAQWVRENVLSGDIKNLTARINAVDPAVRRIMIEHDPEGALLMRNATRLGQAVDAVTALQGEGGDQMLRYFFYRLGFAAAGGLGVHFLGLPVGAAATGGVVAGVFGAKTWANLLARILYNPRLTERAIRVTNFLARYPVLTSPNAMRVLDRMIEEPDVPRRRQQPEAAAPAPTPKPSAALPGRQRNFALPPGGLTPVQEETLTWPPQ